MTITMNTKIKFSLKQKLLILFSREMTLAFINPRFHKEELNNAKADLSEVKE